MSAAWGGNPKMRHWIYHEHEGKAFSIMKLMKSMKGGEMLCLPCLSFMSFMVKTAFIEVKIFFLPPWALRVLHRALRAFVGSGPGILFRW